MAFLQTALGLSTFPPDLRNLSIKYLVLQIVVSGIYLSYSWISLYYISVLDSFSTFGAIVAIGMMCGAVLDIPLGILTDRFGQRVAFCCALGCLVLYYLGMIFASKTVDFLILEIIVGIYSALLSGSFIAWFMNSWESLAAKENELLFRAAIGNINFAKTLVVALVTFIGGYLLQQDNFQPQLIFLLQALIAGSGVLIGLKFITTPKSKNYNKTYKKEISIPNEKLRRKNLLLIRDNYILIIPIFFGLSILSFTSVSYSTLVLAPLIYEITSISNVFRKTDIKISFSSISVLLISMVRSLSEFVFAITSRFSGRLTSFVKSPRKGLILIYVIIFPMAWIINACVLMIEISSLIKIMLVILIYFIRVILSGLSIGIYWQFYFNITSPKTRSSQESLFNTISLIVSIIGFNLIGIIIEANGFINALLFLFFISNLGIILLLLANNS